MNKEAKVRVVADGVDGFFNRAREHARKLDRGEKLEAELVITFEDAVRYRGNEDPDEKKSTGRTG